MAKKPAKAPEASRLHAALSSACPMPDAKPINRVALRQDASRALSSISSLLGYQQYLDEARAWKATGARVPVGFERELEAQSAEALVDTHALASSALQMTSQFKHSGRLDRMLARWISAIEQSGPVRISEMLSDLQLDEEVRWALRDEGIDDQIWSNLLANFALISGEVSVRDGELIAELTVRGDAQPRRVVLSGQAPGKRQTLTNLLRRGTFERLAPEFVENMGATLHLVPGETRNLDMAEAVLGLSLLAIQSIAAHSRGLRDIGLAKYSGNAVVVIWAVAALTAFVIGYLLADKYCDEDGTPIDDGSVAEKVACVAGQILCILSFFGAFVLLAGLFPAGPGGPYSCAGTTVYVYDPVQGKFVYSHCDPFPAISN